MPSKDLRVTYIAIKEDAGATPDHFRRALTRLFGTNFRIDQSLDHPDYLEIWAPRRITDADFEQFCEEEFGYVEELSDDEEEGGDHDAGPSDPQKKHRSRKKKKKKHKSKKHSSEHEHRDHHRKQGHRSDDEYDDHHRRDRHGSDDEYDDHHRKHKHRRHGCSIL